MRNILKIAFLGLALVACKKSEEIGPNTGQAIVTVDESNREVVEALSEGYKIHYPNATLSIKTEMEDVALVNFLNGKVDMISMSRELDAKEKTILKNNLGVNWKPARYAADAVVFVVHKDDPRTYIDVQEIKKALESGETSLVADAGNGSNINNLCRYFKIPLAKAQFKVIHGNVAVAERVLTQKNMLGVIGFNSISRPHSEKFKALRSGLKILPVRQNNELLAPSLANLQQNKYPFTKILYLLTKEHHFGLCNGFIRFSCTQLGQIVVSKQGIQPYYRYKRKILLQ